MYNGADYLIVVVVGLSALIGLWRGFAKEVLSLLIWVLAFALTYMFYPSFGALLPIGDSATLWIREAIAAVLIFICTMIAGALISSAINGLVKVTGLTGTDRTLGLVFGLARAGIVIIALLMFLPTVTPIAEQRWWENSQLIPLFLGFEDWAISLYENLMSWVKNILGSNS